MEAEFSGVEVVLGLLRAGGADVAKSLHGCSFYENDPEALFKICEVNIQTREVHAESEGIARRVSFARLRQHYVIAHDTRLQTALERQIKPDELIRRESRRVAQTFGVDETPPAPVERMLRALTTDSEYLPTRRDRTQLYVFFQRAPDDRSLIRLLRNLTGRSSHPLPDVLIELAAALRRSGNLDQALRTTDGFEDAGALQPYDRAVLATQRAAIHLDFFELRGDELRLARAEKCLKLAWAIAPGDHVSNVYHRLHSLRC